jgi:hypothetical protein
MVADAGASDHRLGFSGEFVNRSMRHDGKHDPLRQAVSSVGISKR